MKGKKEGGDKKGREGRKRGKGENEREKKEREKKKQSSTAGLEPRPFTLQPTNRLEGRFACTYYTCIYRKFRF